MHQRGGCLTAERLSCAALALLSVTAFAHRALRSPAATAGATHAWAFWALSFVLYVAVGVGAARRSGRVPPGQAAADLLRLAGAGFLLAYFSLEMP